MHGSVVILSIWSDLGQRWTHRRVTRPTRYASRDPPDMRHVTHRHVSRDPPDMRHVIRCGARDAMATSYDLA